MCVFFDPQTGRMTLKEDGSEGTNTLVWVASLEIEDPNFEPHTITLDDDDYNVVSTLEDK